MSKKNNSTPEENIQETPAIQRTLTREMVEVEGKQFKDLSNGQEYKFEHKSDMFRQLFDMGLTVGDISAVTGSHYSFVYGVISSSRTIEKKEGTSKSDLIRSMAEEGKTAGQIAKELNSNYSFVHSVIKKYKQELLKKAQ